MAAIETQGGGLDFHARNLDVAGFGVSAVAWMTARELLDNALDARQDMDTHQHSVALLVAPVPQSPGMLAITAVNVGAPLDASAMQRQLGTLHCSSKAGNSGGALGKYGLGVKLAALASATFAGVDAGSLAATVEGSGSKHTSASSGAGGTAHLAEQYARLQRLPGAVHVASVDAVQRRLTVLSLAPPAETGAHSLAPVLPALEVALDGSSAQALLSCVAVRVVVSGESEPLLSRLATYLATARLHPAHVGGVAVYDQVCSLAAAPLTSVCLQGVGQLLGDTAGPGMRCNLLTNRLEEQAHAPALAQRTLCASDADALTHVVHAQVGVAAANGMHCSVWAVLHRVAAEAEGVAGGVLPAPTASSANPAQVKEGEVVPTADLWLFRYANGAPLLDDAGNCAITAAVAGLDWAALGMECGALLPPPPADATLAAAALDGAVHSAHGALRCAGAAAPGLRFHRLTLLVNLARGPGQVPLEFTGLSKTSVAGSKHSACIAAALAQALHALQARLPLLLEDAVSASARMRQRVFADNVLASLSAVLPALTPETRAAAEALVGAKDAAFLPTVAALLRDAVACNRFAELAMGHQGANAAAHVVSTPAAVAQDPTSAPS